MDDRFQYPVFFECPHLDREQRRKIENYFQVRRKSGGGQCSSLTNTSEKVYSIAFVEREAQQRVLEKCTHKLEFAGEPLVLTVRGSPEHCSSSPSAPLSLDQSISGNQDRSSSQECPKAEEELEKKLASVACSAQLYPDEGRLLVKSMAQACSADKGRNWKAEVDKLFDAYLCHYEVDSHKVKALLQSRSSGQTTDEVKVYSEGGLAVVVGKHGQVIARLKDVEQSTVNVKGHVQLRSKLVFVAWVKPNAASSGMRLYVVWAKIFQELRSHRAMQLDDAEIALQGEFTEVKIDVPNCTTVPPELREKLKSKTHEMNQRQYRAQVLFGADSSVTLLGHTKEVEELNEVVTQVILDHSCVEGKVTLKFTELLQFLPDLLQLHKFDYSGVTFHPLTSSSVPMAVLEGPSNKVTEVRNRLGPFLDSLVQGSVTINMPGAVSCQDTARGDGVHVEVVQGTIETQQVEVLVSPMAGHDPLSTRVGYALSAVVGPQLVDKFHRNAGGATLPGDIVLVDSLPALQSKAVIFLNLLPWDNNQNGTAVQALRQGIRKILASCGIRALTSVALPVLGTGAVLRFPHSVASRVLLEEVRAFEQNRMNTSPFRVRVVIHPRTKNLASLLYRHVSVTADEITSTLGTVKLQMVHGDIVNEVTDVIINTTDFSNSQSGVSKAILTAAGPIVQAELAQGQNWKSLGTTCSWSPQSERLDDMELEAVLAKIRVFGISVEERHQRSGSVDSDRAGNTARAQAKDRSGSGKDVYVLRGLKEDVLSVTELVNTAVHKVLCEDLQDKEEAMLALNVQWSIKDNGGTWHELSLRDNYVLENAHIMKQISVNVTAPDGMTVKVNLKTQEGTNWQTGLTYKVERLESAAYASGLKRLYVARVLTGRYTVGNAAWTAPPPRGTDRTDRFDSLVNNQQQPTIKGKLSQRERGEEREESRVG
ncbi:hypothetical protein INR49_005077 [Caranx melampygus]|nr:hypothetical protein INR49_005077 [Caranx melampygus]